MTKKPRVAQHSPAMQQFFRAKERYPDALLLFRMGDFYELFFDDAILASRLLEIALTSRGKDRSGQAIPMAGVPFHAVGGYIERLVAQGHKVAVCEQIGDPSKIKGVVPREVVRVVTPGLVLEPESLDAASPNYLVGVTAAGDRFGLAALEYSTCELRACELTTAADVSAELVRLEPRELLLHGAARERSPALGQAARGASVRELDDAALQAAASIEHVQSLARQGQNVALADAARLAVAAVLSYAQQAQPGLPLPVLRVAPYDPGAHLLLDEAAVRNLEIVRTLQGERKGALVSFIDKTRTAMGARLLRQRLLSPLACVETIRRRHDCVQALCDDPVLRDQVRQLLSQVHDLERLTTRVTAGLAGPRDLGAIRDSLRAAEKLAVCVCNDTDAFAAGDWRRSLRPEPLCQPLARALCDALAEQPPVAANAGGVFRPGCDAALDELRDLASSGKELMLQLEAEERERTGISSLKVRFTRVFGYYIEITKSNLRSVPGDYRRKQTVAGGERFITERLESLQARILGAEERSRMLELERFIELRTRVAGSAAQLRALAARLARLDVHAALAEAAHAYDHVRPALDDGTGLQLTEARHPAVERMLPAGTFVPNDVCLEADAERLMIITGPNMAGKSTVMRQTALAVILAQAGAFVPASSARIGLVDRLYTRVGASDDLVAGQSTFMLEMRETANILHGATRRSLVLLDEIGRGTSTYDGLSIAWAVAEYLHDAVGCRTMFATHYHELCQLAASRDGSVNYNVAASEYGEDVVFLHKLVRGAANRSYGIAVARLAGVPATVLARARTLLRELETQDGAAALVEQASAQLDLFAGSSSPRPAVSELESTLEALELDTLTPLQALSALAHLKSLLRPGS
ncbi:MAG: DNA mismatch repair protein MutS [Proteobacteria bacterium]|nr:DNA mismatch repair protein MutS [Pseudomonadota bacterium]